MSTTGSPTQPGGSVVARYLRTHTNPPVFLISGAVVLAFLAVGSVFVSGTKTAADQALSFIATNFGWFYVLSATGFLLFCVGLMISRFGKLRLGPDDSRPEWRTGSWFAMLFTAGMGIGLVFYGVYEPPYHMQNFPNGAPPGTEAAADTGMNWTIFHWGFHPWAIYAVLGLAMGYFAFRKGLPLRPASALYPLIGRRIYGWPGNLIDILAVFGTLFGLATSLGIGAQQVGAGLDELTGGALPNNTTLQILVVVAITAVAVVSVMAGLDKGIRRLSVTAMAFGVLLAAFVFVAGPTLFILTGLVDYTGTYLQTLPTNSFTVFNPQMDEAAASWQSTWTLFYWGWWISWSPFVGMFVARISRGRTVRQFIGGMLIAPVGASIAWFSVFGGSALYYQLTNRATFAATQNPNMDGTEGPAAEQAMFTLMDALPVGPILATIASIVAVLIVVLFFATSSDSGSFVVDMLTNGGDPHPIWQQRLFWAVLEGAVAAVLLFVGGDQALSALQAASITTGLPFAVVLIIVAVGLVKGMQNDRVPVPAVDRAGSARSGISTPTRSQAQAPAGAAPETADEPASRTTTTVVGE